MKDFEADDEMVYPIAKGDIGDAYLELDDKENAIKYYLKAVNASKNDFTTPIYLMKAARVYEDMGNNEKALELYKKIDTEFHNSTEANSIEKYITRVETKLEK